MLKRKLKRFIACLLTAMIAGGTLCPSFVFASEVTSLGNNLNVSVFNSSLTGWFYYPNDCVIDFGYGMTVPVNSFASKGYYVYSSDSAKEVVPMTSSRVNGIDAMLREATGFSIQDFRAIKNLANGDGNDYTNKVLLQIDSTLGSGIDNMEDLAQQLNNLNSSQGSSVADITTLNQRFAMFMYMAMNPSEFGNRSGFKYENYDSIDNTDYKDMLDVTLSLGHDTRLDTLVYRMLGEQVVPIANRYYCATEVNMHSIQRLGFLSIVDDDVALDENKLVDTNRFLVPANEVYMANVLALYICLTEYVEFQIYQIPEITSTTGWDQNEEVKGILTYVRIFNDAFGDYVPLIRTTYETKNGDWSLKDMVEKAGVTDTSMADISLGANDVYVAHEDTTSPITTFYTINGDVGIVSYDRDRILADREVDLAADEALEIELNSQHRSENAELDDTQYNLENMYLANQVDAAIDLREFIKEYKEKIIEASGVSESNAEQFFESYLGVATYPYGYNVEAIEKYVNTPETYDTLRNKVEGHTYDILFNIIQDEVSDTVSKSIDNCVAERDYKELCRILILPAVTNLLDELILINQNVNENGDPVDEDGNKIESELLKYIRENEASLKSALEADPDLLTGGIDENGEAYSLYAVTMNAFIVEGMGYSASYIPMRTNVYSSDTLNMYKGEGWLSTDFYKLYLKYGFMRKALLIDTSSSSAADFYTSGGKSTHSTRICTLRDLLYSGNSDVTLYLDSQFYNADTAIEEGNKHLNSKREKNENLARSLRSYADIWDTYDNWTPESASMMANLIDADTFPSRSVVRWLADVDNAPDWDEVQTEMIKSFLNTYNFNLNRFESVTDVDNYIEELMVANTNSEDHELTESVLKTNSYDSYSDITRARLADSANSSYVNVIEPSVTVTNATSGETGMAAVSAVSGVSVNLVQNTLTNTYGGDLAHAVRNSSTDDNKDTLVLSSATIGEYMAPNVSFSSTDKVEEDGTVTTVTTTYTTVPEYSPLLSLAYVSCLYRDDKYYTLANTVEYNNPVFMASDDLCGIKEANQWYRNTLLNYALLKNLMGNAQVDISFITDLDCPVYMDIFGNILTESGTVVIPAAANATLHPASYKDHVYATALYSCYGKEYYVPIDCKGASSVLQPYFVPDGNSEKYILNGITMSVDGNMIRFDKISSYDDKTKEAIRAAYKATISHADSTRLNWVAMVKIVNEVMRGAPIESIDKDEESLYISQSKSSLIAAAKLESLLNSLNSTGANSLLAIPDFSRMDGIEYWVAILIKIMIVATAAVIIVAVYRDGVSGQLGLRTFWKSISAIALTVSCIVVVPAIFQLTYYSSNKLLLEDEALRILMVNEEKRQGGAEIGITEINNVESNGEFALQLDWVSVPWYEELEDILYNSSLDNLQRVKLEAYRNTATYMNNDVTMYNDGIYVTTDDLFDSVAIDFTFNTTSKSKGLYLNTTDSAQTASFYSPYYVFLRSIVANINEYNRWIATSEGKYSTEDIATENDSGNSEVVGSYNYTTKYMSQNRLKTVGLCEAYFTSKGFMESNEDILRLRQIYMGESVDAEDVFKYWDSLNERLKSNDPATKEAARNEILKYNPAKIYLQQQESATNRSMLFSDTNRSQFEQSYWYDSDLIYADLEYYMGLQDVQGRAESSGVEYTASELQNEYIKKRISNFEDKVSAMDEYARNFIADNKDLIGRVSDETFIKTMALAMAIKYNQLFGVASANTLEMYNMSSEDFLRLCLVPTDEAVISTAMSYPRFVHTFGGEVGVYLGAVLSVILWLGSYIKPLCTIVVFVSVFLSIFIFRVVLRKPSANIVGYLVTCGLLCATNFLHALILKISVWLPNAGLSTVGCMIFIIVGQVCYLLVLSYVTGVSLKDWSNLGATEYEKEARRIKDKFRKEETALALSGNIKHHDNNWDYYNDLVDQHRSRNK